MKTGKYDAFIIDAYEAIGAHGNDHSDHREYSIGYFSNEIAAREAGKGKGFYRDGDVRPVKLLGIGGTYFKLGEEVTLFNRSVEKIRKTALAKLTPEEREALDLKEE